MKPYLFAAFLFIVSYQLSIVNSLAQQCCDVPGWQYVVQVDINNTYAGNVAQANYQVLLMVNTQTPISQGKMNANGSDIRFTDINCGPFLNYYIESGINTTATAIWVQVPSLPANAVTSLFMYYGNAGAIAASNFAALFPSVYTLNAATTLSGVQTYDWIDIQAGGTINLTAGAPLTLNARRIIVSGTINGNSCGYGAGGGPGPGQNGGGSRGGGGGGYGGIGGSGGCGGGNSGAASGTSNGNDIDMGSGGGSSDCNSNAAGGGAVTLNATEIDIAGTISMNGASMGGSCSEEAAGAGAGGGIIVSAEYINGSGAMNARGGAGQNSGNKEGGGGGGGGRVKLFYCQQNNFAGAINVSKGPPGNGGQCSANDGQDGTSTATATPCLAVTFGAESLIRIMPVAAFTAPDVCFGTSAAYTDASTIGAGATITNWSWNFGDLSATATQQNTTHVYAAPNTFQVTLTITSSEGCVATVTQPLTVHVPPTPDFTFVSQCDGTAVPFTDISTAPAPQNIVSWGWDFNGDLAPDAVTQNPSFTFPGPGSYTVGLGVITDIGCSSGIQHQVTVYPNPVADFNATSVCEGLQTAFTDASTGVPVSWAWDFGDGVGVAATQNPSYTYATAGSYSVILTITDANGCQNSVTKSVDVYPPPVAAFAAVGACENLPVAFTDNSTVPNPHTVTGWNWDFGDASPTSALQNPTHAYTTAGNYNATLVATSDVGCTATVTQPITVFISPLVSFNFTNECENVQINFSDNSTIAAPSSIVGWSWNFGDGNTSAVNPAPHTYTADGTYNVSITVTTSDGCQATVSNPVAVYPEPVADFTVAAVCENNSSFFVDGSSVSSGTVTNWDWDFGGGNTDVVQNPTYTFTYVAPTTNYPVTLTATTNFGCQASVTKDAVVNPLPAANFTTSPAVVCEDSPVSFDGTPTNPTVPIAGWDYNFNNFQGLPIPSTHAYTEDATFTYNTSLIYNVRLTVTSDQGCTSFVTNQVPISPLPNPEFTFTNVCQGMATPFTDASSIVIGTITTFTWDYGDNLSDPNIQNPTHQYAAAGTYTVTLTTASADQCTSSISHDVIVYPNPQPSFTATNVCQGLPSVFANSSTIATGTITSYSWDYGDGSPANNDQNPTPYLYAAANNYQVTLTTTSDLNCITSVTNTYSVFPNPVADFTFQLPLSTCLPVSVRFTSNSTVATIAGQTNDPLELLYDFGDGGSATSDGLPYVYTTPGTFDVTLTVTTQNSCISTIAQAQIITVNPVPTAEFSQSESEVDLFEPNVDFTNQSNGETAYDWDFGDGLPNATMENPTHTYTDTGCFPVWLYVENQYGCRDSTDHQVCVKPFYALYIPNAFSSNEDKRNPIFNAIGEGVKEYEMRVFNRWGEEVFRTKSMEHGWDGIVASNGMDAQQDVYAYWVRTLDYKDRKHLYQGHVTLLR